jgi:stage II sporulation protein D
MVRTLSLIFLLSIILSAKAEFINIGVFHSKKIESFHFSIRAGKYAVFTERGKLKEINAKSDISVTYKDGVLVLKENEKVLGAYQKINLMGVGWYNHFMVKSEKPAGLERRFDDNLMIVAMRNEMRLINNLDLDNYVAGVVEAEVGRKPPKEYFKLQAIICRTYALSNTQKHVIEGFNLCDEVHCQAYHGKTFFPEIVEASMQTRGAVIVDSDIQLITAAFHSNCGGQTVNSEDVWSKSLYYLRSVNDTFCLQKKNSIWEKEVALSDWRNFLIAKLPSSVAEKDYLNFQSFDRETFFSSSNLSFEDLRDRFKLRSTFFNGEFVEDKIILKGRGYGHGVGLCQEGAMEMAALGYSYSEILHFYYRGVHIIDLSALDFFRED